MSQPPRILLAVAAVWLAAAAAAAGSLDFWEDSRGAPDVTAVFPTGAAQVADIDFDADSAEGGGLLYYPTDIEIRPTGSVAFVAFECHIGGCNPDDYEFVAGNAGAGGKLIVSFIGGFELHGVFDLGAITFDAPQEPGGIALVGCAYTGLDPEFTEHSCSPFALVSLPEPARAAGLFAGGALLFGPLRRRRAHRTSVCGRTFA